MGTSKAQLRAFPKDARGEAGHQLHQVEEGLEPLRWKVMKTVGQGVREIKISEKSGEYRVFYVASFKTAAYVLHAFSKKSEQTPDREIEQGKRMYKLAVKLEAQRKKAQQQQEKRNERSK